MLVKTVYEQVFLNFFLTLSMVTVFWRTKLLKKIGLFCQITESILLGITNKEI
jgi:hypothetical protein